MAIINGFFYSSSSYDSLLFVQWKFAFLSLGRPEYLQDSDIVSSRFQVCLWSNEVKSELWFCVLRVRVLYFQYFGFVFYREEMFMVLGSSTLGWSTLIMLLRELMPQIK